MDKTRPNIKFFCTIKRRWKFVFLYLLRNLYWPIYLHMVKKLVITLLVLFSFSQLLKAQYKWELLNPYPTNNAINSVCFPSPERGYLSDFWNLYRTSDGGQEWEKLDVPFNTQDLFFHDNMYGWAAAIDSIYSTQDGGETWQAHYVTDNARAYYIYWYNEQIGYVFGAGPYLAKSTDGGLTWERDLFFPAVIPEIETQIVQVKFLNPFDGYVLAIYRDSSYLFRTTDAGNNWSEIPVPAGVDYIGCFDLLSFDNIWIGEGRSYNTYSDSICTAFHSTDGGNTWSEHMLGPARTRALKVLSIKFFDELTGCAFDNGYIYRTSDGGQTWNVNAKSLDNAWYTDSQNNFFSGSDPDLFCTHDGGINYTNLLKGHTEHFWSVYFSDSLNGCAGSEYFDAHIRYTNDGGNTWEPAQTDRQPEYCYNFDFATKNRGWAPSSEYLFNTRDGGKTWTSSMFPSGFNMYDICAVDTTHLFLQGWIHLLRSDDGGQTFTDISVRQLIDTASLWIWEGPFVFTDSFNGFASYFNPQTDIETLYKTSDGGNTWELLPGDFGDITVMEFSDPLHGIVVDWQHGTRITRDGGYTWTPLSIFPAYINMPDSMTIIASTIGIYFFDENYLSIKNFVQISHDGGQTFETIVTEAENFPSQPVFSFPDDKHGFAAGNSGTMLCWNYHTPGGGEPQFIPEELTTLKPLFAPNPAVNNIRILDDNYTSYTLRNLSGALILNNNIPCSHEIDISMVPSGPFLITLTGEKGTVIGKGIKF